MDGPHLRPTMEPRRAPTNVYGARPVVPPEYARAAADDRRGPRLEQVPLFSARAMLAIALMALVVLVVLLPALLGFIAFVQGRAEQPDPAAVRADLLWLNVAFQVLLFGVVPVVYVMLVRPRQRVWGALGLGVNRWTPIQVVLGIGVSIGALIVLGLVLFALEQLGLFSEDPSVLVEELERVVRENPHFVLILPLVAGVTEEIFFRGLLQRRIGLVASSLLFGLVHVGYGTWVQVVAPVVLGFFFGLLYRWTRSLWTAISAHFCFDFIQFALLFFVDEGSEPSMATLLSTRFL